MEANLKWLSSQWLKKGTGLLGGPQEGKTAPRVAGHKRERRMMKQLLLSKGPQQSSGGEYGEMK